MKNIAGNCVDSYKTPNLTRVTKVRYYKINVRKNICLRKSEVNLKKK